MYCYVDSRCVNISFISINDPRLILPDRATYGVPYDVPHKLCHKVCRTSCAVWCVTQVVPYDVPQNLWHMMNRKSCAMRCTVHVVSYGVPPVADPGFEERGLWGLAPNIFLVNFCQIRGLF